jgi:hypothetical protein
MLHKRKEEHGRKLMRRSFGKTEIDGESWLLGDSHTVETSKEEEGREEE